MIEACFLLPSGFKKKVLIAEVMGHAGFARKGDDIVCAAVSCLMNTLAVSCERIGGALVTLETGNYYRLYVEDVSYPEKTLTLLHGVITGMSLLAEQYPDNVKIQIKQRNKNGS